MSRPRSSVPNGCASDGGARTATKSGARGSYGERSGARRLAATNAATSPAPTRPTGLFRNLTSAAAYGPAPSMSVEADPRVEIRVEDVHDEVRQHVADREEQDHPLHDEEVPAE